MAKATSSVTKSKSYIPGAPKKTRQGSGAGTKCAASSRNGASKKYRGQGR